MIEDETMEIELSEEDCAHANSLMFKSYLQRHCQRCFRFQPRRYPRGIPYQGGLKQGR